MIKETNISYTSDKIDDFINQINIDIETAKNIFNTSLSKVKQISVEDVLDNTEAAEDYLTKIQTAGGMISKKHKKYFNVVDMYGIEELPNNVRTLEKLTEILDNYYFDLMKVEDTLSGIIEATQKLTNFYNK
jgi:conjugal transfer/entry exclusion protein